MCAHTQPRKRSVNQGRGDHRRRDEALAASRVSLSVMLALVIAVLLSTACRNVPEIELEIRAVHAMANGHDVFAIVNTFVPTFELWRIDERGEAVWRRRPDCGSIWGVSADDQLVVIRCSYSAHTVEHPSTNRVVRVIAYSTDGTRLWTHDEASEAGSVPDDDAGKATGVVRLRSGDVLVTTDAHAWLLDRQTGALRLMRPITGRVGRFDERLEFIGDQDVSILDPIWVRIFCDGRNLIDFARLVSGTLSGSIASG